MKKRFLILLFVLITSGIYAQRNGIIFFKGSWDEVVIKAKNENKLIFIDFYTKWCGPCKMMADEIFVTKAVGDFYNSNFINYKIDAESIEGIPIARKYKVNLYPTFIFVNPSTLDAVHYSTSRQEEEIFLFTGESAIIEEKNSVYLEKLAAKESTDTGFLYNYAFYNSSKGNREIADKYILMYIKETGKDLSDPNLWRYFNLFIKDRRSPLVHEFINNRGKYSNIYGTEAVNDLLFSLHKFISDEKELEQSVDFPGKEYLQKRISLNNALRLKKYSNAKEIAEELMSGYHGRTADFCRDINYIIRIPGDKHREENIDPSLLEIYIILCRYAAYNNPDRDAGTSHFNYALLMEYLIKNNMIKEMGILTSPVKFGVGEYSMRSPDLEKKPIKKEL